ncbi:hypothetical protein MRX96_022354 [Rhipicephalus microplus]
MSTRIRVRKEQKIALISASDPDLAVQLCHLQMLKLVLYEVSAYVVSPDNSCKGVITEALPIPTKNALKNDTVTHSQSVNIIQARPFGTNEACIYTFEGKRVLRYVYFQGVDFDADLSDQSPKCATAASELATDTTSAHIQRNTGVEIEAFSTRANTMVVASNAV